MSAPQSGILAPLPRQARYLTFELAAGETERQQALGEALVRLRQELTAWGGDPCTAVVGVGRCLVSALGGAIPGLTDESPIEGIGLSLPLTPAALWCWLRGCDRGHIALRARRLCSLLEPALRLRDSVDAFFHDDGRDLTGYEDGTENPTGQQAQDTALIRRGGPGLEGSSFVSVQHWVHDLSRFARLGPADRDAAIGRRRSDNEELPEAPASAHVKRTAQESFSPPAFLWRRSMPWADASGEGLEFVAFCSSLAPFNAQLRRMVGQDDGTVDALFGFSRPTRTSHFWCPPLAGDELDLRRLLGS